MAYLRLLLLVLAFGVGLLCPRMSFAEEKQGKPNVLFIAIDDLNDWTGALGGHPQARTPNFDKLAGKSTLFTQAHCVAPACNPSRAALMSGQRPWTTGIYHNNQPWHPVLKETLTLNKFFRKQGYHVVGGGKIYHGSRTTDSGWDEYYKRPGDPRPSVASVSGLNKAQFDWGPVNAPDEKMGDYQLVEWAKRKLVKKSDKPLFLAVGFVKPHLPWYVPKKYFDMYPLDSIQLPKVPDDDLDDIPAAGVRMARPQGDHAAVVKGKQWKQAVQGYLATVTFLDVQLGRLMDAFEASPYAQDTIVVAWGDHGWHLGEKKHWRKFSLWEEATRAPLLFQVPGMTKPGTRCERPVDFQSIYPTLVDLCHLPKPEHVEGVSLVPLLKDPTAKWDRPAITTHGRGNHGVRSEQFRYIRYADGSEELYDHTQDPMEWKNLAKNPKFDDVKAKHAAALPKQEAPNAPQQKRKKKKK